MRPELTREVVSGGSDIQVLSKGVFKVGTCYRSGGEPGWAGRLWPRRRTGGDWRATARLSGGREAEVWGGGGPTRPHLHTSQLPGSPTCSWCGDSNLSSFGEKHFRW